MPAWSELSAGWWTWIASLSIQFVLLAVLFALLDRILARRVPTTVRAALAWALLLRVALPLDVTSPVTVARVLGDVPARAEAITFAPELLCAAWAAGVVAFAALSIARSTRARRAWLADARPAPIDVMATARRTARLLGHASCAPVFVSASARGPACVGLLQPVVVLPVALAARADDPRLLHVLLHELAHVARRDALAACAWELARAILWFHPLVHLAARRASTLREIACDERAARALGDARGYRGTLLDLARPFAARQPAVASAFLPPEAQILARLAALERPFRISRGFERAAGLASFALVAACCVPLARPDAAPALAIPALEDLDGCLRKRFAVMAALPAEARSVPDPNDPLPEE